MSKPASLEQFGDQIISLLPQVMKEIARYENNYVTTGKITCQQFLTLCVIADQKQWTMKDLADTMRLSYSSMTGLADRLLKHALIVRRRDEGDRRSVIVSTTPKGKKIIREVYGQKRRGMMELFGRLSARERQDYLDILNKLVDKLSSKKS